MAGQKERRSAPYSMSTIVALALASSIAQLLPRRQTAAPPHTASYGSTSTLDKTGSPASGSDTNQITKRTLFQITKNVLARVSKDNLMLVAAGVAFYAMTTIFPAIAAFVSIYGLFADPAAVQEKIAGFSGLLPAESLKLLTDALKNFSDKNHASLNIALVVSVVLALWSAKAGVSALISGLNIANETTEKRGFFKLQALALAMTAGSLVFAIVAIVAIAVVPAIFNVFPLPDGVKWIVGLLRWPVLAGLVTVGLAIMYYFGPCVEHRKWHWVSWGAAIATGLWLIGSLLFSFYVSQFGSYDKTYGSLAAPIILLLWFWLSALIILLGEEIDAELLAADEKTVRAVPDSAP